jgi:hypothetical protein
MDPPRNLNMAGCERLSSALCISIASKTLALVLLNNHVNTMAKAITDIGSVMGILPITISGRCQRAHAAPRIRLAHSAERPTCSVGRLGVPAPTWVLPGAADPRNEQQEEKGRDEPGPGSDCSKLGLGAKHDVEHGRTGADGDWQ